MDEKDKKIKELEEKLKDLENKLQMSLNWAPLDATSVPSGPNEIINAYRVGWINSWVLHRQTLKKLIYGGG